MQPSPSTRSSLVRATSVDLVRVVRAIHKGFMPSPITRAHLIASGFGHAEAELEALVGLDPRAALVVVSAVLAERGATKQGNTAMFRLGDTVLPDAAASCILSAEREFVIAGDIGPLEQTVSFVEVPTRRLRREAGANGVLVVDDKAFVLLSGEFGVVVRDAGETRALLRDLLRESDHKPSLELAHALDASALESTGDTSTVKHP
jgi:hypothetical protein